MKMFEWFVAWRYLRARRKQTVISVVTLISILGVAAGVAAMIVALSISSGFRENLQDKLLKGTAHLNVKPVFSSEGIGNPEDLTTRIREVPGIRSASAALYGPVLMSTGSRQDGVMLKGIAVDDPLVRGQFFQVLKGDLGRLAGSEEDRTDDHLAVGVDLAQRLGLLVGGACLRPCPGPLGAVRLRCPMGVYRASLGPESSGDRPAGFGDRVPSGRYLPGRTHRPADQAGSGRRL